MTLSSAWVRLSSAAALSALSVARSSSWEVVNVVRPKVVCLIVGNFVLGLHKKVFIKIQYIKIIGLGLAINHKIPVKKRNKSSRKTKRYLYDADAYYVMMRLL